MTGYDDDLTQVWALLAEQEAREEQRLQAEEAEQFAEELQEVVEDNEFLDSPDVREAVIARLEELGPVDPSIVPALVEQAAAAVTTFDPLTPAKDEPTREEQIRATLESKGENPDDPGAQTMQGIADAGNKPSVFT